MDTELKIIENQEPRCVHSAIDAVHEGKLYQFGMKQDPKDCMNCSWFSLAEEIRVTESWQMVQIITDDEADEEKRYIAEMFPDGLSSVRGVGENPARALRSLQGELTDFWKDQESQ
jgi:hypothetical protein